MKPIHEKELRKLAICVVCDRKIGETGIGSAREDEDDPWTPVGKGLPDSDLTVLVTLEDRKTKDREVSVGYHDGEGWRDELGVRVDPQGFEVTHWKDLPEPAMRKEDA